MTEEPSHFTVWSFLQIPVSCISQNLGYISSHPLDSFSYFLLPLSHTTVYHLLPRSYLFFPSFSTFSHINHYNLYAVVDLQLRGSVQIFALLRQ